MRWPWRKAERRSSSFEGIVTDAILASAEGGDRGEWDPETKEYGPGDASAAGLAATEAAAGLIGRCFAGAEVTGDRYGMVTPPVLELIGRELVRRGEAVFLIEGDPGAMRLTPAGTWDVRGGDDSSRWFYRVDTFGASRHRTRLQAAAGIVHARINPDPVRPWQGRAPWRVAALTATTAANSERSAGKDARIPSARVVPVPTGGTPGQEEKLTTGFRDRVKRGGIVAVLAGFPASARESQGRARDWTPGTVRPDPSSGHVELRQRSAADMLAACGVSPALMDPRSDGTTRREAYRQLVMATLNPWGRIVAAELTAKLGATIRLDFGALQGADLAIRSRAFKALTDAGLPVPEALALTGLVEGAA